MCDFFSIEVANRMAVQEKKSSLEKRMVKVSMVTWLSTAFSMGAQLISVPICLRYWGKGTYGVWLAVLAAYVMLRTVDGGYVSYIGNKLNMLYHKDMHKLKLTMSSAIYGVLVLGFIQLILLIIFYVSNHMSLIMDIQDNSVADNDIFIALFVLSISWILSGSYIGIIHRLQIPAGMMYQAAWWSMGFQVSQFIVLIVAAMSRLNILQTSVMYAFVQALIYITSAIYLKVKLPTFYPWWDGANIKRGLDNVMRSVPLTFSGILQQCGNSVLIMIIAAFLGPVAIPAFSTLRTLTNLWTTLINILTSPLLPDVIRFHAVCDWKKLLSVHQAHLILVGAIINLSIIVSYPFLGDFFSIWTRHRLVLDKSLLDLLLATVPLLCMGALINTLLSGVNHYGFIMSYSALRGVLVLILSCVLLPLCGITGLGVAIFSTEVLVFLISVQWFYRFIGDGGLKLKSLVWGYLSSLCIIIYLLVTSFGIQLGYTGYAITCIGIILSAALGWKTLDLEVKQRINNLIHKRKK